MENDDKKLVRKRANVNQCELLTSKLCHSVMKTSQNKSCLGAWKRRKSTNSRHRWLDRRTLFNL